MSDTNYWKIQYDNLDTVQKKTPSTHFGQWKIGFNWIQQKKWEIDEKKKTRVKNTIMNEKYEMTIV